MTAYYQYKLPNPPVATKVPIKEITQGTKFSGKYITTFTDEDMGTKTHLIDDEKLGMITLKGATMLNRGFEIATPGTYFEATYEGLGKKQKGRRPAFLWTVDLDLSTIKPSTKNPQPKETDNDTSAPAADVAQAPATLSAEQEAQLESEELAAATPEFEEEVPF